jgi:hypothetical protein
MRITTKTLKLKNYMVSIYFLILKYYRMTTTFDLDYNNGKCLPCDVSDPLYPCYRTYTSISFKLIMKNYQGDQMFGGYSEGNAWVVEFFDRKDYNRAKSIYNHKMKPKKLQDLPIKEQIETIKLLNK